MSDISTLGGQGLDFDGWTCPLPLRDSPTVVMGHGGGGQLSAELVEHLFVPAFGSQPGAGQGDSAGFSLGGGPRGVSPRTLVVRPLFFPRAPRCPPVGDGAGADPAPS